MLLTLTAVLGDQRRELSLLGFGELSRLLGVEQGRKPFGGGCVEQVFLVRKTRREIHRKQVAQAHVENGRCRSGQLEVGSLDGGTMRPLVKGGQIDVQAEPLSDLTLELDYRQASLLEQCAKSWVDRDTHVIGLRLRSMPAF